MDCKGGKQRQARKAQAIWADRYRSAGVTSESWVSAIPWDLQSRLEVVRYEVSLEVNNANPDQDFYRMSHAKYIVVSSGGFSRLVGQNARRHGGKIIGAAFRERKMCGRQKFIDANGNVYQKMLCFNQTNSNR